MTDVAPRGRASAVPERCGMVFGSFLTALLLASPVTTLDPAAAAPGGLPSAAALRANVDAARGTPPARERLTVSVVSGGVAGTSVSYRDGANERTTQSTGPVHEQFGVYNGQAWLQNKNGETVLRQPDPGAATYERYDVKVERVSAPLDAYVISKLDLRGEGTRTFIDPTTYRVLRLERIGGNATTVTTFDDFRTTNGATRAWHWHSTDGFSPNVTDAHVTAIDENVSAADLKIPGGRTFVEFPTGQTVVQLPAKLLRDDKFLIRVDVGGRGLDFVLDTGAAGIFLEDGTAKELGLKIYAAYSNPNNAGRFVQNESVIPEMRVGDLKMRDVAVTTVPSVGMELPGDYKAVGLLGFDFIADLALRLDCERGTVTATTSDTFAPPKDPLALSLPLRLGSNEPLTDVTINGALGERFLIDTGAVGGLTVLDSFARRHPEALIDAGHQTALAPRLHGIGGALKTQALQLKSVVIGKANFKDFVAYRLFGSSYAALGDGIIGPGFLDYFTLYTDYGDSEMYLVPNALGRSSGAH